MSSNSDVVRAWGLGRCSTTRNMRTDGVRLWSYNLIIGDTLEGRKVLYMFMAGKLGYISATTSHHVSCATIAADTRIEHPDVLRYYLGCSVEDYIRQSVADVDAWYRARSGRVSLYEYLRIRRALRTRINGGGGHERCKSAA